MNAMDNVVILSDEEHEGLLNKIERLESENERLMELVRIGARLAKSTLEDDSND